MGNSIVRAGQQSYADKVAAQEAQSRAIGAIGRTAVDTRGFDDPTGPDLTNIVKQSAANLSADAAKQQAARDAETAAASAARRDAEVRQANGFVAGARQNELSIRNLVRTTNLDRQAAAYQRTLDNDIRNERYRIGNEQAASQFDSISSTGFDVGKFYADNNVIENQRISNHYLNAEKRRSLDVGETNAIEVEFGIDGDFYFFGASLHASFTIDNQRGFTPAIGYSLRGSSNDTVGISGFGTVLKGYGASSEQLGTGVSETSFARFSITDLADEIGGRRFANVVDRRPVDIGVFAENGYTINDFTGDRQFAVEGYGFDYGIQDIEIENRLLKGFKVDAPFGLQGGFERESSWSPTVTQDINVGVSGDIAYGLLNRIFFD